MGRSAAAKALSISLGWAYFAAWSLSFYPQVFMNARRRSVVGLSFDYQLYNIVGYTCYSAYTCALRFNSKIRSEYDDAFSSNLVTLQVGRLEYVG